MRQYLKLSQGLPVLEEYQTDCWVSVEMPNEDDLNFLEQELRIPPEFLSDIADVDERPRMEREGEWQMTLIRIPLESSLPGLPYMTIPLGVITNEETTVTICYRRSNLLPDFINHNRRKGVNFRSQEDFITRLIYSSAVWFLKYLKLIYLELSRAEKELEQNVRNEDLLRIMRLQKSLVYFDTSIQGNQAILGRMRMMEEVDKTLIDDVRIELRQGESTVGIYKSICMSTMDALTNISSNNLNTVMKRMAALSIIMTIPTMIGSFYGMNVDVYIDKWVPSFAVIVVVSILLSFLAFLLFRRIKWF